MSHEIKLHEAQTAILRELLFLPSAGFAELQKPTGLTSDHFTFHINRLVEIELVERIAKGRYQLTTKGKEYANRLDTDNRTMERQGKICVLVVPLRQRANGETEYMVQRRLKQPFYGYHGYMTGKLRWGETAEQGAARELLEETGMTATFRLAGLHHKLDFSSDGEHLEDKHFYIFSASDLGGDFIPEFEGGSNHWMTRTEMGQLERVFDDMEVVIDILEAGQLVFWEKQYTYHKDQY